MSSIAKNELLLIIRRKLIMQLWTWITLVWVYCPYMHAHSVYHVYGKVYGYKARHEYFGCHDLKLLFLTLLAWRTVKNSGWVTNLTAGLCSSRVIFWLLIGEDEPSLLESKKGKKKSQPSFFSGTHADDCSHMPMTMFTKENTTSYSFHLTQLEKMSKESWK